MQTRICMCSCTCIYMHRVAPTNYDSDLIYTAMQVSFHVAQTCKGIDLHIHASLPSRSCAWLLLGAVPHIQRRSCRSNSRSIFLRSKSPDHIEPPGEPRRARRANKRATPNHKRATSSRQASHVEHAEPTSEPCQTAPPSSDHIFLARGELLELQDHAS